MYGISWMKIGDKKNKTTILTVDVNQITLKMESFPVDSQDCIQKGNGVPVSCWPLRTRLKLMDSEIYAW